MGIGYSIFILNQRRVHVLNIKQSGIKIDVQLDEHVNNRQLTIIHEQSQCPSG